MEASLIIVNYNTQEHLEKCLTSILYFTKKIDFEIIVIDNNSPEREIENFPRLFPRARFYFRDVNDGFGSGCNYGASKAKGNYLVFVNPDIVFDSDCLSKMFEYMESNLDAGAVSPVLKDFAGKLTYIYNQFPNIFWEFHEATGKGNQKKMDDNLKVFYDQKKYGVNIEVDWVTGACIMIKSELFRKLKGYDENYFLYYEDTDLQYRIRQLGFKIFCLSDKEVKHFINSSIKSSEGENIYYFNINRSKLIYMYKHFGFSKRNAVRIMHILGIGLRTVTLPFRRKFKENRGQKFLQYKRSLKLYFYTYNEIVRSSYLRVK
ncbi:MAG: glycosyltransferase family 2 protein [Ignavibacteria bacterium]